MRFTSIGLFALMTAATLTACSSNDGSQGTGNGNDAGGAADASSTTPDAAPLADGGDDAGAAGDDASGGGGDDAGGGGDDAAGGDAGDAGVGTGAVDSGNTVTLTVMNYRNYCDVTIDDAGITNDNDSPLTVNVTPGTVVTLVASPADAMFSMIADPWFGVDQNDGGAAPGTIQGSGADETSTATVTVNGKHCVSVCCDFPGVDPCPATSQCP